MRAVEYPSWQLINFEKRRKEFELLTTITLLQMGCETMEREKASHKFQEFIALVQPLTDSQGYEVISSLVLKSEHKNLMADSAFANGGKW